MTLPLPLLVPFLISMGWRAIPHSAHIPVLHQAEAARSVGSVCLTVDPVDSRTAPPDSIVPPPAALSLWMQAPLQDLHSSVMEPSAARKVTDILSLPAAAVSGAGSPVFTMATLDQPRDQAFRIPLAGAVFLFGQAERDGLAPAQGSRLIGQTGVTWKLPVQAGLELLLSCGPEVTYTDVLRSDRAPDHSLLPFQTRLLRVDLQCRWHLLEQVGLECQGSVCPALNPGEQDAFYQDLHLAFPLTRRGQFLLGAKRYWEKAADVKPGPDSGQLYGDVRLTW